jgi:hypothetical protein
MLQSALSVFPGLGFFIPFQEALDIKVEGKEMRPAIGRTVGPRQEGELFLI